MRDRRRFAPSRRPSSTLDARALIREGRSRAPAGCVVAHPTRQCRGSEPESQGPRRKTGHSSGRADCRPGRPCRQLVRRHRNGPARHRPSRQLPRQPRQAPLGECANLVDRPADRGTACVMVGGYSVVWRERIVARLIARPHARTVQAPMAYAVMGVILAAAGIALVLSATL